MKERGNILFLILLAVVLFAALSYAVTSSMRGNGKDASAEKAQLDQSVLDNFQAEMDGALLRLKTTGGCTDAQISYETPAGANVNSNAPADKHCHVFSPLGAGVPWRNLGLGAGCPLTSLAIGQNCNGVVYVGALSSVRLYTAVSNNSNSAWTSTTAVSGAGSASDGLANTNALLAANNGISYPPAESCRTLGAQWYLPSDDEMNVLYLSKAIISNLPTGTLYWSSRHTGTAARACSLNTWGCSSVAYTSSLPIRCMRRD